MQTVGGRFFRKVFCCCVSEPKKRNNNRDADTTESTEKPSLAASIREHLENPSKWFTSLQDDKEALESWSY